LFYVQLNTSAVYTPMMNYPGLSGSFHTYRRSQDTGGAIAIIRRIYRRLISRRGATSVEFAIVAMPCLLLLFAIMNFSAALYSYDFVCYSAQQAARYAIVNGAGSPNPVTAAGSETYVDGLVVGVPNTNYLTVRTTWTPNNEPGSVVTVKVTYTYYPPTSFVESANISLPEPQLW
jgi:Flp pilus assembly protein TadG